MKYFYFLLCMPILAICQKQQLTNINTQIEQPYTTITPDSLAFNDSLFEEGVCENWKYAGYCTALLNGKKIKLYPFLKYQKTGDVLHLWLYDFDAYPDYRMLYRHIFLGYLPNFPSYSNCYAREYPIAAILNEIDNGCSFSAIFYPKNSGEEKDNTFAKVISYDKKTRILKARFEGTFYIILKTEHDHWDLEKIEILDGIVCAKVLEDAKHPPEIKISD